MKGVISNTWRVELTSAMRLQTASRLGSGIRMHFGFGPLDEPPHPHFEVTQPDHHTSDFGTYYLLAPLPRGMGLVRGPQTLLATDDCGTLPHRNSKGDQLGISQGISRVKVSYLAILLIRPVMHKKFRLRIDMPHYFSTLK